MEYPVGVKENFKISEIYNEASVLNEPDKDKKKYICRNAENIENKQFLYTKDMEHDKIGYMSAKTGSKSYRKDHQFV